MQIQISKSKDLLFFKDELKRALTKLYYLENGIKDPDKEFTKPQQVRRYIKALFALAHEKGLMNERDLERALRISFKNVAWRWEKDEFNEYVYLAYDNFHNVSPGKCLLAYESYALVIFSREDMKIYVNWITGRQFSTEKGKVAFDYHWYETYKEDPNNLKKKIIRLHGDLTMRIIDVNKNINELLWDNYLKEKVDFALMGYLETWDSYYRKIMDTFHAFEEVLNNSDNYWLAYDKQFNKKVLEKVKPLVDKLHDLKRLYYKEKGKRFVLNPRSGFWTNKGKIIELFNLPLLNLAERIITKRRKEIIPFALKHKDNIMELLEHYLKQLKKSTRKIKIVYKSRNSLEDRHIIKFIGIQKSMSSYIILSNIMLQHPEHGFLNYDRFSKEGFTILASFSTF